MRKTMAVCTMLLMTIASWMGLQRFRGLMAKNSEQALSVASLVDENASLRRENSKLERQLKELGGLSAQSASAKKAEYTVVNAEKNSLAQLLAIADLQKQELVTGMISPVAFGGQLDARFKERFLLTDKEQARLQRAIDHVREKIEAGAFANASVRSSPNGSVVIDVAPLKEAPNLYDELMDEFKETLGSQRFPAFLTLSEPMMSGALDNFGGETRSLTFSRVAELDPKLGQLYLIFDAHNRGASSSNGTSRLTRDMMVRQFGSLTRLLPPGF